MTGSPLLMLQAPLLELDCGVLDLKPIPQDGAEPLQDLVAAFAAYPHEQAIIAPAATPLRHDRLNKSAG